MGKAIFGIVIVAIVGIVAMMLYRSAAGEDFPDDEWFEFEVPEEI